LQTSSDDAVLAICEYAVLAIWENAVLAICIQGETAPSANDDRTEQRMLFCASSEIKQV